MKEIIEGWVGVFMIMLLVTASVGCISASIDYRNADASKTGYIAEIENSNFSAPVMAKVFEHANEDGYTVKLRLYHRSVDGTSESITSPATAADIGNTDDVYMARLQLDFKYKFKMLNVVTNRSLIGYAR